MATLHHPGLRRQIQPGEILPDPLLKRGQTRWARSGLGTGDGFQFGHDVVF